MSYPGTYINLSLGQSWKVYKEISVDLAASAGYFAGDSGYWKTYQSGTGNYTGDKYRAFHDGLFKAGLTIPITQTLAVQPAVMCWFPLSDQAKRSVDGRSYNPNGKLDHTLVAGINCAFTF